MKKILILLVIVFLNFSGYRKPGVNLHIINTNIKDGEMITFQIKNNSNENYCFVIDTLFPEKSNDYYYYENAFVNPKKIIESSRNELVSFWIKDIFLYEKEYQNIKMKNHNYVGNNLSLIFVKSNSGVKFKLPLDLIQKIDEQTIAYYKLDGNKKYKCGVEYFIKKEFIDRKFPKRIIDSIQQKGYKFFTGRLVSNKVPLLLK